ncbi:transporter substrate-binding domain-containing protein [Fluoribacter gormanii]|nr:transporter substrate-binding domain-containing protein [Fluoribacter gormanii]MCW8444529.1 transporter substrate-binding domain-containing protein [Fluoribacter gormanii]MCW8469721.1 transporter substrate-binding domain-containing protein [Fluoribacter gormanii]
MMLFISTLSLSSPLKVGVSIAGPPLVERVNTAQGPYYFGFFIDLMNNICKRIGTTCIYQEITLNNEFEFLDSGKIDVLIPIKPYTSSELKQYAASIPYAVSKIHFITSKDSPISDLADIENKKIGVIKQTFYDLLVQTSFQNHNQIVAYNKESDLLTDLAQHKIDVIVLNNIIAQRLLNNNLYNIKLIGQDIPLGQGYGILALTDKAALIAEINKAILSLEKDGTYTSIYDKYYNP